MKPYKCPICNGKGIVSGGFYKSVNEYCSTTNMTETCQQCGGGGIIWGNEDSLEPCDGCAPKVKAISPVSREQVEKAWMGCKYCDEEWGTCNPITNRFTMPPRGGIRFCPMCGRPLTDEAVEIRLKELEALKDV